MKRAKIAILPTTTTINFHKCLLKLFVDDGSRLGVENSSLYPFLLFKVKIFEGFPRRQKYKH
jgi:hypothetical protein